jgi:protein-S-isoprenylcysteine O-methyltransferase Ste14
MDAFRYFLALFILIVIPPSGLHWLIIHPLVGFWRRLGPRWTRTIVWSFLGCLMVLLFIARKPLLSVEFGTSWPLAVIGLALLGAAIVMVSKIKKQLTVRTAHGGPELDTSGGPGTLLTEGIYGVIRHPRYVELVIGLLGYTLIANYLAVYALLVLYVAIFYIVVLLEERELRGRFGEAYVEYCRRVPRFIPRSGRLG